MVQLYYRVVVSICIPTSKIHPQWYTIVNFFLLVLLFFISTILIDVHYVFFICNSLVTIVVVHLFYVYTCHLYIFAKNLFRSFTHLILIFSSVEFIYSSTSPLTDIWFGNFCPSMLLVFKIFCRENILHINGMQSANYLFDKLCF